MKMTFFLNVGSQLFMQSIRETSELKSQKSLNFMPFKTLIAPCPLGIFDAENGQSNKMIFIPTGQTRPCELILDHLVSVVHLL